jgi:1-deoxy-D-xylulose-5-phosphate reductoisomerase
VGSTGSIGKNTLEIVRRFPKLFQVDSLAVKENINELESQIREFKPRSVAVWDKSKASELKKRISQKNTRVLAGPEGLNELCSQKGASLVVFSMVGACGLEPLLKVIESKKNVAVANKEPLAIAGSLIRKACEKNSVQLLPIDSELSGLFQCLDGKSKEHVRHLVITASGGPFWKLKKTQFNRITVAQALKHPKWKMGAKITIDSATLMNKGLEVIETSNFFQIPAKSIQILIHPEAIVHSIVEFLDGSHIAQISVTDMKIPILYAISYPSRLSNPFSKFRFSKSPMNFFEPDVKKFPSLGLAYWAAEKKGTLPAVMNASNEIAVERFLENQLPFTQITKVVEKVMRKHRVIEEPLLKNIFEADRWAREEANKLC